MTPKIDRAGFGWVQIEGLVFKHDVVIRLNGQIEPRRKELSRRAYGTSHLISMAEITAVYEAGADRLIIGTGLFSRVHLSPEASAFLAERGCRVELLSTPKAVRHWNGSVGTAIGLFHTSC
jgi:hypothetical protein